MFSNFMKGDYKETNGIYVENYAYSGVPGLDYSEPESTWVGSHAVVIVGWGEDVVNEETVHYWVVRNSWGTDWCNQGTFKIAMYGNDPNKKYQNRISQFEYPSIVNTDEGIGITGGVILMKAGSIEANSVVEPDTDYNTGGELLQPSVQSSTSPNISQTTISPQNSQTSVQPSISSSQYSPPNGGNGGNNETTILLYIILLLSTFLALFYVFMGDINSNTVILKIIFILIILGLLVQLINKSS